MKRRWVILFLLGLAASRLAAQSAGETAPFEFNGLVVAGDRTLVCITPQPDRRSRWIAVGSQMDGIRVTSFDRDSYQVVVEQSGRSHTIALKRATAGVAVPQASAPAGPLPVAAPAAPVAITEAQKEQEARFLVSDLLEIGMIQRKAYEEAQKKAAEEKAKQQTED